ncbi:MAG: cytochrome ubiquinol oxidase subunit I [Bacteroidota bacterium]|nr:cytochrome ubiquinol oxidase subunit I [Bacteroidota bacterium]
MLENFDWALVDWSRYQFALTALYHWLFVPLTLGITWIIAIMETLYVRTGDPEWKKITKFWMKLFGINFAIGVATGIILEFEFGTNWSSYSWFVGDIFGAPLAIEGIMAFFMESTFIAIMFFGWKKVSKKFHLTSTWLVAIGANLSALWILVANAWMQKPVGTIFNPDTARMEMTSFWDVLLSPVAVNKFIHTITNGFVLAAIFVIGISAWFLLKNRETRLALRSMTIASIFGLVAGLVLIFSGDTSTKIIAEVQPMKLAAMEGLYDGKEECGLVAIGVLSSKEKRTSGDEFLFKLELPKMLSWLSFGDAQEFVPGINDLIRGNAERGLLPVSEKIKRGKYARELLSEYKAKQDLGDIEGAAKIKETFYTEDFRDNYFAYFGYAFNDDLNYYIPNVPLTFYSFHIMVGLGFYFLIFFALVLFFASKGQLPKRKFLLRLAIFTVPLAYVASEAGWIVAELGRQPWTVQDLLPTVAAVTKIDASSVQVTFWLFTLTFTALAVAEVGIMIKAIKNGSKNEGGTK